MGLSSFIFLWWAPKDMCNVNKKAQLSLTTSATLEIQVMGHSRASKVTPFDTLHMVSYYRPIVTLCLKCTVFEILRHIGWKLPFPFDAAKTPAHNHPSLINRPHWGWPLSNFGMSRIFPQTGLFRLTNGEEIMTLALFVLIQYWHVMDRQDTSLSQRPCYA